MAAWAQSTPRVRPAKIVSTAARDLPPAVVLCRLRTLLRRRHRRRRRRRTLPRLSTAPPSRRPNALRAGRAAAWVRAVARGLMPMAALASASACGTTAHPIPPAQRLRLRCPRSRRPWSSSRMPSASTTTMQARLGPPALSGLSTLSSASVAPRRIRLRHLTTSSAVWTPRAQPAPAQPPTAAASTSTRAPRVPAMPAATTTLATSPPTRGQLSFTRHPERVTPPSATRSFTHPEQPQSTRVAQHRTSKGAQ